MASRYILDQKISKLIKSHKAVVSAIQWELKELIEKFNIGRLTQVLGETFSVKLFKFFVSHLLSGENNSSHTLLLAHI